ncbi:hypothetical protein BOC44_21755 (plasmid) [Burkholderia pseudomallei]|nr:hypothetical protein BOC44_21755 [Burkholderia pseudomallei]
MRAEPYLQRFANDVLAWKKASGDPTLNEFLPIAEAAMLEEGETRAEGLLQFAREVLAWHETSADPTINLLLETAREGVGIAEARDVPSAQGQALAVAEGPALVTLISIHGQESRDMYDDRPGVAYFGVARARNFPLREPLPLNQAMEVAEEEWTKLRNENGLDDPDIKQYDRQFSPSKILLLDAAERVVQQFNGREWVIDIAAPDEWPALLARASELEAMSSDEARWEDYSYTSARLSEQARDLRNRVSIAQASLELTAGPECGAIEAPVAPAAAEPKTLGAMVDARPIEDMYPGETGCRY